MIIAIIIRSLIFQPFYIPSSSMEPTLLIGDRIFCLKNMSMDIANILFLLVQKYILKVFFYNQPEIGDLVVFKTPSDNRTDYIKRLIGLPGDEIQFKVNGNILINGSKRFKRKSIT